MKSIKFISLTISVCILSCILTFVVTNNFLNKTKSEPINAKSEAEDLYKSELILTENYQKCGHTVSDATLGTVSYSSAEELTQRYPGYKITAGEGEKIVLTSDADSYCPNHFFARLDNNEIAITRLCDNKTVTIIKTDSLFLSSQEKKLLEAGITLNSDEALTSFIEDFTS